VSPSPPAGAYHKVAISSQPLLSLSARGSVARAITFSAWRGIQVARAYSAPTCNPSQSQQQAREQRDVALNFWRATQRANPMHDGWQRAMSLQQRPNNVANFAISRGFDGLSLDPDAIQATSASWTGTVLVMDITRIRDILPNMVTRAARLTAGDRPRNMQLVSTTPITGPTWSDNIDVTLTANRYFQLHALLGNVWVPISGIVRLD